MNSKIASEKIDNYKQALTEMHANRKHFSEDAFNTMVLLLLNEMREAQTSSPVQENANDDEIRLVTVMFVDVKDSTELVHRLEAGDWKTLLAETHELIASVVARWDGLVGQYLGDGVLCFFGAQRSRGDDAPHAVSCALEIKQAMIPYAAQLREQHGIDFGVRISISTGRVVVGMIGSPTTRQELLALGAATNLAARLQTITPVGDVLVDKTTYQRIRRDFITQAQPSVSLKGFEEPISSYRVLGRRNQPATQFTEHQIAGITLPMVGREEEWAVINYLAEEALHQPRCQVITFVGDVGVGKSRLLQETVRLFDDQFAQIIMSAHYETRGRTQTLLYDLLTTQCHIREDTAPEMIQQQIEAFVSEMWAHPEAAHTAAALGYLAGFDVEAPPGNLFEWVLRWFAGIAETTPLLIVIDNLHWADEQSIALMEQLALYLAHKPCLLIAAGQRGYQTLYPLYMTGYPHHTQITLEALDADSTQTLIDSVLRHVERVPDTLVKTINQRVEGNPLFVYEYLSMLFDNGAFQQTDDGNWRFNILMMDTALQTIPNHLLGILQAQVDSLNAQARQIIQAAAVIGQVFWEGAIQALSGMPAISKALDNLVIRGVIARDDESILAGEVQYHFRLSLYQTVTYEMIPRAKREHYHREMAIWLLGRISGQEHLYGLLAEQFELSRQYTAALYSYVEAIEVKLLHNAPDNILPMIDRSLGLVNHLSRDEALTIATRLWTYRGQGLAMLGRYDESSAASRSALMLLDELPDEQLPSVRLQAERALGVANMSLGRFNEAFDALTRAHNLLPYNANDDISTLLHSFAQLSLYQGRLDDSNAYARRAHELALKAGQPGLQANAATMIGMIALDKGEIPAALTMFERALMIYHVERIERPAHYVLFQVGLVHLWLMQYEAASNYFNDALAIPQERPLEPIAQAYQAYTLLLLDRKVQAQVLLSEALENRPRDVYMETDLRVIHLAALYELGDYVQVRERGMALLEHKLVNPLQQARTMLRLGIASHILRTQDAVDILQQALSLEMQYGGRDVWLCHLMLGRCSSDPDQAKTHYQQAAELLMNRANSLHNYPQLRAGLLESHMAQEAFERSGIHPELSGG